MLKKYRNSGTRLSEKQLKEIKGGTADADFSEQKVQCGPGGVCSLITCDDPSGPSYILTCVRGVCEKYFCP